jgi:glucose-1-phosphate adenylyltransferase
VRRIGVVTQYKSHSLVKHLVRGWGHFKKELGEGVEILPASQRYSENWYLGTADAVYQNLDIIRDEIPEFILILSGDHVYRQDYGDMLAYHAEMNADMTVSCMVVPIDEAANSYGVMTVDSNNRIVDFNEKPATPAELPGKPGYCLASMGNYVFNADFLFDQLRRDSSDQSSEHDFGKNIIPGIIKDHRVYAYEFVDPDADILPYWRDVGTLDAYWKANMELVAPTPPLNLYDRRWPIWTFQEQLPPAKFVFDDDERRGQALDSMVAGGVIISGATVRHSVIFSSVRVNSFATVEHSVILPEVKVGRNAKLRKVIVDRACEIPEGAVIGFDADEDRHRGYRVTDQGVTLVTAKALGQEVI